MKTRKVRAVGNIMNRIMETSQGEAPAVGMGATVTHWSDRDGCTVVEVKGKPGDTVYEVLVREDKATRADANGMSDSQSYTYEPNPLGREFRFRMDRDGAWREVNDGKMARKNQGVGLLLGERRSYYDFSF